MKSGIELIAAERQEQIEKHGYTIENDFTMNGLCQLAEAATGLLHVEFEQRRRVRPLGWDELLWEKMCRKDYEERVVISAALLAAERDRLNYNNKTRVVSAPGNFNPGYRK